MTNTKAWVKSSRILQLKSRVVQRFGSEVSLIKIKECFTRTNICNL